MKILSFETQPKRDIQIEQSGQVSKKKRYTSIVIGGAIALGGLAALAIYNKAAIKAKAVPGVKEEFINLCKNVSEKNYVVSEENIKNGIFQLDLHSHSIHSDGWGTVENILNQVSEYANKLYSKTGKKFTFALTDHDRIGGVSEALAIIKNDPEKYKNIRFIPGVELSFAFKSGEHIKSGELLAYFINPSSKEMKILVEDLNKNRLKMLDNAIEKLGENFSRSEMDDYFVNKDGETFAYNLHYRVRNYAQIKNRINKMSVEQNTDSSELYKKLMDEYVFGQNNRLPKPFVTIDGFDKFLKNKNIKTETQKIDKEVDEICSSFYPKIVDGKIVSDTENSFQKIIESFSNNDDVVLAFAHPYYTAKNMVDFKKEFDSLLKISRGKVRMAENYHQAYNSNIPQKELDEINNYLLSKKLIPIGGRDNHCPDFL